MTKALNWKAAIWAGLVAGIVFIMLEMALIVIFQGDSPWGPPRMMAAMVMGEGVLPPPATFDLIIMMVAMMIHLMLSIVLAAILGFGISRSGSGLVAATAVGALFGIAVYVVNFYVFTAVFPWFAMARGTINFVAHGVFGAVAGAVYRGVAGSQALVDETPTVARS